MAKYSKYWIDKIVVKKTDSFISEFGLKTAKRIITEIKKRLLAEDRRRKDLEVKK